MRNFTLISGLASTLAVGASHCLADPPVYRPTSMRAALEELFPDYEYLSSECRALNQNGDMVGEVNVAGGLQHAWIFTFEHGLVLLPLIPGAPAAQAMDLTDRDANGEIIIVGGGVIGVHDHAITAAVWRFSTITGEVIETRDVGNLPGFDEGKLIAVSNGGVALGYQGENVFGNATKYNVLTDTLEPLDFPTRAVDINNDGQIVGDRYIGDLNGGYTQLGLPPDCTSLTLTGINDLGWVIGRAGRPYSDGAGRTLASWVRRTDSGWLVPNPGSPWDTGFAINNHGEFTIGFGAGWIGGVHIDGQDFAVDALIEADLASRYDVRTPYGLNDNLQIAGASGHAVLLTPLGRMIIPGDVNGDVAVNHDDHCAWMVNPIDLDGDQDVDADDELWLIDRLAVFGFIYRDCNGNGINDHCDIAGGSSADCNDNDLPDECEPDCDGDGLPDDCESDCNGNGIPDDCDIDSGFSQDCNDNGIPDECDGADAVTAGVVYDPPRWLYEDVHVVDTVRINTAGIIADVDFTLEDVFRIGQVTVRLSHAGVTVTLIDHPGEPENLQGFVNLGYDITLDDQGAGPNIQTVGEDCCSFGPIVSPPSYRPKESLAAFNGLPREGEWTMEFIGGYPQAVDPTLISWSVIVTDHAVDPGQCCPADLDDDGDADGDDFFAYLDLFAAGDAAADLDGDGDRDADDFFAYLDRFAQGC